MLQHKHFLDPPLCDCGKRRTERAAKILKDEPVDLVLSSNLMRAIETAYLQFGHRPVHVIPHIGLHKWRIIEDLDNEPRLPEAQLEILRDFYPDISVDYGWRNDTAEVSNWAAFEDFLKSKLLPELVLLHPKSSSSYTIGIASHSIFLKNAIGRSPDRSRRSERSETSRESICFGEMPGNGRSKPFNNQVLEIFYYFDSATGELALDTASGCKTLGVSKDLAHGVPGLPRQLCEADVDRCVPLPPVLSPELRKERQFSGPSDSETYSMRGEFPEVQSAEQKWAENWNQCVYGQLLRPFHLLSRWGLCRKAHAMIVSGSTRSGCHLPEYPDTTSKEVCDSGHGGCLGAFLELAPTENLIHIVAFFPEDADWVVSCDTMWHTSEVLGRAKQSLGEAFTACRQRPAHLCSSSPVATSLSCEITENLTLDESTLDAPYKRSTCREEDLTAAVKEALDAYRAVDFSTKAFVVPEGCFSQDDIEQAADTVSRVPLGHTWFRPEAHPLEPRPRALWCRWVF
eukprot:g28125.t1